MEIAEVIDYAYPAMMAENAMKELHNAMLRKDYAEAQRQGGRAVIEVMAALRAIQHMQENAR